MIPVILAIRDENDRSYVELQYKKYGRKLYKLAFKHTNNRLDSEDCVHDTVVVLINHLQDYRSWDEDHQKAFLYRCCRFIAIGKYKKNERNLREIESDVFVENIADVTENVPKKATAREALQKIRDAINEMDPKYGDILYFKAFIGMSNDEIAQIIGISKNLLEVRLHRARGYLHKALKECDLDDIWN